METSTPASGSDPRWLALRKRLWPDTSQAQHLREMRAALERDECVVLALSQAGSAIGFAEASKRSDYVIGTDSSRVGFLEGLYVEPGSRRNGAARALVTAVERGAFSNGLTELASDSLIETADAHDVHRALGFEETERVVFFRKRPRVCAT